MVTLTWGICVNDAMSFAHCEVRMRFDFASCFGQTSHHRGHTSCEVRWIIRCIFNVLLSLSASKIEQTGRAGERETIYVFPNNADGSRKILSQLFWLSPHPKYILELSV